MPYHDPRMDLPTDATDGPSRSTVAEHRLGPSPFGHRSFSEDLTGVVQERIERSSKSTRPGVGTRAGTDPRVVTSPRAFASPRTLISPRGFIAARGTTTIRALPR